MKGLHIAKVRIVQKDRIFINSGCILLCELSPTLFIKDRLYASRKQMNSNV